MEVKGKTVSIREAVTEDLSQISEIEREANPTPWSDSNLESEIEGKNEFWVLTDDETDEKVYGFIIFSTSGLEAHVLEIAISIPNRRQGIGRFMLQRMISFALKQGSESIYLEVRSENEAAVAFYQALGFVIIHRKPKYYSDGADGFSMIFRMTKKEANIEGPNIKQ